MGRVCRRLAIISGLLLMLGGCQWADEPTKSWQLAKQGIYDATLSPQGDRIVIGSIHHGGSLWNTKSFARLYNWNHKEDQFTQILTTAYSSEGGFALTAELTRLVLWNANNGKPIWLWRAPSEIYDADLALDGRFALLGLADFTAVFFDIRNGGVLREFEHLGPIRSVDLSRTGRLAITGSEDLSAIVWDVNSGKLKFRFQHDNSLRLVKISDDDRLALTAANLEKTKIWNLSTGKLHRVLNTGRISLTSARFFDNGNKLLLGSTNRLVQLWDVKTGKLLKSWRMPRTGTNKYSSTFILDVAPVSGAYLAVGSDGHLFMLQ